MTDSSSRPRYYWLVVGVIMIIGTILRFYDLGGPSLWIDEVFTELYARLPVGDMLKFIRDDSSLTPFYFLSLHAYPTDTDFWLRSYSAGLGVLAVLLLIVTAERGTQDWRLALLAGALLAVSPYHIGFSRTARMYSLVCVLSLVISFLFLRLLQGKGTRTSWILFTGLSAVAYVTHYFMAALPMAQYLTLGLIVQRQRSMFRKWVITQAIAVIPLLAWFVYLAQNDTVSIPIAGLPVPEQIDFFVTLVNMTTGFRWDAFPWYAWPGVITALVGLAAGLVTAVRRRTDDLTGWYWGCMVVGTLLLAWTASELLTPLYMDRYFIVFLPGVLLLVVMGWQTLAQNRHQLVYVGAIGLMIVTGAGRTVQLYHNRAQYMEDWSAIAHHIEANALPGDGVATGNAVEILAIQRYTDLEIEYSWLRVPERAEVEPFDEPITRIWILVRMGTAVPHYTQWLLPRVAAGFPIPDGLLVPFVGDRQDQVIEVRTFNGVAMFLINTAAEAEKLAQPVK